MMNMMNSKKQSSNPNPVQDFHEATLQTQFMILTLPEKKTFTLTSQNDVGRVFYETKLKKEENSQKTDTEPKEAPTKRVSDVLKSLSKFDEDIERLRVVDQTNFKSTDASIDQLSPNEMEKELKTFLSNRYTIKSNLDTLVMKVNQSSHDLEQEEDKIRKIKIQIQKEIGAKTGDQLTRKYLNKKSQNSSKDNEWDSIEKSNQNLNIKDVSEVSERKIFLNSEPEKQQTHWERTQDATRNALDKAGNTSQYMKYVNEHIQKQHSEIKGIKKLQEQFDQEVNLLTNNVQNNITNTSDSTNNPNNPDLSNLKNSLQKERTLTGQYLDQLKDEVLKTEKIFKNSMNNYKMLKIIVDQYN